MWPGGSLLLFAWLPTSKAGSMSESSIWRGYGDGRRGSMLLAGVADERADVEGSAPLAGSPGDGEGAGCSGRGAARESQRSLICCPGTPESCGRGAMNSASGVTPLAVVLMH